MTFQRVALVPYKMSSESCKKLQVELKKQLNDFPVIRLRRERLNVTARSTDFAVFWGNPESPAANKLKFFRECDNYDVINIPEWTTNKYVAAAWRREGRIEVAGFARTILTGHSGRGIIPFNHGETTPLPDAPLYVKYVKKSAEYRVHVFNGSVIDVVQKRRRANFPNINNQIRNVENGWVFCRNDLDIADKEPLYQQATLACKIAKLDFGAVDIIYNTHQNKYYVLEVNTAPGLEGTTVETYAKAIVDYMKGSK